MKIILCFAAFCACLSAQNITVHLDVPIPTAVLGDIQQHFLAQTVGTVGTLTGSMDDSTTSVTVTISLPSTSDPISARVVVPATVGAAWVIDAEPMVVASVSAPSNGTQSVTLTRNIIANLPPMSTHSTGATVYALKYSTPWAMLVDEALRPWTLGVIQNLGPRSLTLSSGITGSITQ